MAHENRNNIFITELLTAYPVPLKNNNKVVLPPSLLREIHDKKVWDNREKDKPLIFELIVSDPDTADVLEETHVGVESFTAPNGKIGLPYKAALSLTKHRGIEWLQENPLVSVRLINVESAPQSSMKVQPRGKGFFLADESVVNLDIRTVLELTLTDHLVLTLGDWIPLFWEGNRFELVVKELAPGEVIDVLNTDLTVEMMPSEETEHSIKEKQEAQAKVKAFMDKREARNADLLKRYADFTNADKKAADSVTVRVRLPKGGNVTKTFNSGEKFQVIADVVDLDLYKKNFVPMRLPPADVHCFFKVVYAMPGKKKIVIDTNAHWEDSIASVLKKYGIKGKMLSFSLEMIKEEIVDEKAAEAKKGIMHINDEWRKMADRLEACLEESEEEVVDLLPPEEIADITEKLVAVGVDKELAAKVARLYGKQVNQLIGMGYQEQLVRAATLLNDKRGNMEQVVNALLA